MAPARSLPMPWVPVCGLEVLLVAVVDQGVEPVDAFDHDVAAAAAIAAVGAAELDELFAQEARPRRRRHRRSGQRPWPGRGISCVLVLSRGRFGTVRAAQAARVSWVSIWRTSSPRARQSRVERADLDEAELASGSPARRLLKWKTPECERGARRWRRSTSRAPPRTASLMKPRFQNGCAQPVADHRALRVVVEADMADQPLARQVDGEAGFARRRVRPPGPQPALGVGEPIGIGHAATGCPTTAKLSRNRAIRSASVMHRLPQGQPAGGEASHPSWAARSSRKTIGRPSLAPIGVGGLRRCA